VPSRGGWDRDGSVTIRLTDEALLPWALEAARLWSGAGIKFRFVVGGRADVPSTEIDLTIGFTQTKKIATYYVGGDWIGVDPENIRDPRYAANAAQIIAHEIGHWFGLAHNNKNIGIMRSSVGFTPGTISTSELKYVRSRIL
jgi:hypothetical protein